MYFRDPKNVERTKLAQQQIADRQQQLGLKPIKADGLWGDNSEMAYQQLLAIDGNDFRIGRDITKVPTPQGVKVMARPTIRPALASPTGLEASVINRLTNAENSRYDQRNSVGPGHFGKYQFEPMLITKYAGVSPDEFLRSPELQELAMRRRMADLRTEAESALRKTKSNLPLEDTMVLVHFKGLPQTMRELQNPELMNKPTKHNPSSNTYLYHRSFK